MQILIIHRTVCYGGYQTVLYYIVLIAQEVNSLSSGATALRFLPMGATGFIFSMSMGKIIERFDTKKVLLVGMLMMIAAPIPSSLIKEGDVSL
jgi:predicted MFS family arabinose efflux permease